MQLEEIQFYLSERLYSPHCQRLAKKHSFTCPDSFTLCTVSAQPANQPLTASGKPHSLHFRNAVGVTSNLLRNSRLKLDKFSNPVRWAIYSTVSSLLRNA